MKILRWLVLSILLIFSLIITAGADSKTELTNVAMSRPVTAASEVSDWGGKSNINDDDINTFWFGSEGDGTAEKNRWIQIDLLRLYKIEKIELFDRPSYDNTDGYNNGRLFLDILASNTADFSSYVKIGEVGGADTFPKFGKFTIELPEPTAYRYIRIKKQNIDHEFILAEIKIYANQTVTEVAKGKPATASSSYADGYLPPKANNGTNIDPGDCWLTFTAGDYHYWQVDLGREYPIGMIELEARNVGNDADDDSVRRDIIIYGSLSDEAPNKSSAVMGSGFIQLTSPITTASFPPQKEGYYKGITIDSTPVRYLTYKKTTSTNATIGQFRAFVINPEVIDVAVTGNVIKFDFSDEMDENSLNENTIKLLCNNEELSYNIVNKMANSYEIELSEQVFGERIEAVVKTGVTNRGNVNIAEEYIKSFTARDEIEIISSGFEASALTGSNVKISVKAKNNNMADSADIIVVLALYNNENTMVDVISKKAEIGIGDEEDINAELSLTDYEDLTGYRAVAYFWNNYIYTKTLSENKLCQ